ncbi:hypothetical protein FQN53_000395 [Emmonsiellopsis sp. PD_33]|nr:hypothetical protein FQN53_000395 [Emmonsiellopsis sp. PD_33]KAK2793666.1 hypothetical protein FQN51_001178 [Onygenales sp. PD_10]
MEDFQLLASLSRSSYAQHVQSLTYSGSLYVNPSVRNPASFSQHIYTDLHYLRDSTVADRLEFPYHRIQPSLKKLYKRQSRIVATNADVSALRRAVQQFAKLKKLRLEFKRIVDPKVPPQLIKTLNNTRLEFAPNPVLCSAPALRRHLIAVMTAIRQSRNKLISISTFEIESNSAFTPYPMVPGIQAAIAPALIGIEMVLLDSITPLGSPLYGTLLYQCQFHALRHLRLHKQKIYIDELRAFIQTQAPMLRSLRLSNVFLRHSNMQNPAYGFGTGELPPLDILVEMSEIGKTRRLSEVAIVEGPFQLLDMSPFEKLLLGELQLAAFNPRFLKALINGPDVPSWDDVDKAITRILRMLYSPAGITYY